MLGLFGTKSTHPLADAKEAKRILSELAACEAIACVDETTGWFESLAGLEDIPALIRYKRTVELATTSLPATRRLARDYLTATRPSRPQEQQGWQRNHAYWVQLTAALQRSLDDADADPKARDALRPQLGALLAGLLIARFGCLRWAQLRYGPFDENQWADLGRLYLRAVQEKIAENSVEPFGDQEGSTTAAREYLKIQIFHASSMGSLTPLEISLAERFIAHFLPHFVLSTDLRPESAYWVDADKPLPPTRLAKLPALSPTLRFFGAGPALTAARDMRARILASQAPPAAVNLGGQYAVPTLLAVLDHLTMCWSPQPPTRNFQRHRVKSRVGACAGFSAVHALLAGTQIGKINIESWLVEDISQGGMSVRLPLSRHEWVKIGALLGLQPEGGSNWLIGTVRRFARETEVQGVVGIQTLSKIPLAAIATDGIMQTDLILLDPLRDDSSARILLPVGNWEEGVPVQLFVDGHPWRLHPEEKIEAGDDWLIGRCVVEALDPR
jgi:hypothetical protein